jgi:hypothetical protein
MYVQYVVFHLICTVGSENLHSVPLSEGIRSSINNKPRKKSQETINGQTDHTVRVKPLFLPGPACTVHYMKFCELSTYESP